MQKELDNLTKCARSVQVAEDDLVAVAQKYEQLITYLHRQVNAVQRAMAEDQVVRQADENLKTLEAEHANAEELAEQAVINYWEEFGFETGKKSVVMDGCQLRIRETTTRQVEDPDAMVVAAREDGVYTKVIQELRPIVNRASFNSWVDLKSPPGVEVTHAVTASVTILEEE